MHDDHRERLLAAGKVLKDELRNDFSRHLKRRFGTQRPPWFFFVMEDLTVASLPTRVHAHGSIEVRPSPIPTRGKGSRKLARLAQTDRKRAELEAGKLLIKAALNAAAGGQEPRVAKSTGTDQSRNLWTRKPYKAVFNPEWVDYAFKNVGAVSTKLGEPRLAMHQPLLQETKRLWRLVRDGEAAMSEWD